MIMMKSLFGDDFCIKGPLHGKYSHTKHSDTGLCWYIYIQSGLALHQNGQHGRHLEDIIFICIFVNKKLHFNQIKCSFEKKNSLT